MGLCEVGALGHVDNFYLVVSGNQLFTDFPETRHSQICPPRPARNIDTKSEAACASSPFTPRDSTLPSGLSRHGVDVHQIARLSVRLGNKSGRHELNCPAVFGFQRLGDLPRIADEVVTGERKLEPKPPFLRVQSPAQREPSHIAPI